MQVCDGLRWQHNFFDLDGMALRIAELKGYAVTATVAEAYCGSIISDAIGHIKTSKKF